MKKIMILVEDGYEDQELWYPLLRLREANFEPVVVGNELRTYKSKHGYPVEANATFNDVSVGEFQGVVVPGGYAPDKLRQYDDVKNMVRKFDESNKLLASICHGALVFVSADVLKGRRATCYKAIADNVRNSGAEYIDAEVVVDRNLITSRTPVDLPAFMKKILDFLNKTTQ